MDNIEISCLLESHPVTAEHFLGVYSIDRLPRYPSMGYYVLNLDPSYKSGSHWVALKINRNKHQNIYFDSYGMAPQHIKIRKFLKNSYTWNTRRLQHPLSTTCGQWCLYFILRRCQGWSLKKMLRPFYAENLFINNHILDMVIKEHFGTHNSKVIDRAFLEGKKFWKNLKRVTKIVAEEIKGFQIIIF